jgi:hypothetical protein
MGAVVSDHGEGGIGAEVSAQGEGGIGAVVSVASHGDGGMGAVPSDSVMAFTAIALVRTNSANTTTTSHLDMLPLRVANYPAGSLVGFMPSRGKF